MTAGAPCPDYSVVSGKQEGRNQPEGAKFGIFIDKVKALKEALPEHKFLTVAENVIMNDQSDYRYISEKMEAEPIVMDGGDSSFLSRPRLWQEVKQHPLTGQKVQWSQHNGHRQIRLAIPH